MSVFNIRLPTERKLQEGGNCVCPARLTPHARGPSPCLIYSKHTINKCNIGEQTTSEKPIDILIPGKQFMSLSSLGQLSLETFMCLIRLTL